MSSFLRKSPFKNVHGTLLPPEASYSELKPHQPLGDQNLLAASDTRISYPTNDKTLAVLGLERTGKLGGASLPSYSHSSPVEGFEVSGMRACSAKPPPGTAPPSPYLTLPPLSSRSFLLMIRTTSCP